jgi:hypothetical protein
MKCLAGLLLLLAAGCSTAPIADILDCACPPRMPPPSTPSYGGVGIPQSAPPAAAIIQPPAPATVPVSPIEQPVPVVPPR